MVRSTLQKRIASALLLTTIAVQLQTSGALAILQGTPVFAPLIGVETAEAQFLAQCMDGLDNDGDGLRDWPLDPGCSWVTDETESDAPQPPASGGGFTLESALPKYGKTWISSITCRDGNGNTQSFGGELSQGQPRTLRGAAARAGPRL